MRIYVSASGDTVVNRTHVNRTRVNRTRTLGQAQIVTYVDCRSRWVSVNPQVTIDEDTFIRLSAALYDQSGQRIATPDGYLAYGDFFANFASPLTLTWPVWSGPVPAGGDHVDVMLEANPDTPDAYVITATVSCKT